MIFVFIFLQNFNVMTLCTWFDICSSGKVNSAERYQNRVARFELNRAYMKIRTPNSFCKIKLNFLNIFMDFGDL